MAVLIVFLPSRGAVRASTAVAQSGAGRQSNIQKTLLPEELRRQLEALLTGLEQGTLPPDIARQKLADLKDLVAQMNLDEKAGMMLIDSLNSDLGGKTGTGTYTNADELINKQLMSRFIFRNPVTAAPNGVQVTGFGAVQISPLEAATWANTIQQMREATRLGIPAIFKSNSSSWPLPEFRFRSFPTSASSSIQARRSASSVRAAPARPRWCAA